MPDAAEVARRIREAFASVDRPGNWALRGSLEGTEPALVEEAFSDKPDWQSLDPDFLDDAPAGYGSALSFLSDEAFRYFLPAYLLADLDDRLVRADPAFHLCYGVGAPQRDQPLNPRRFGARTWGDAMDHRLSTFLSGEVEAIVAYLRHKLTVADAHTLVMIQAALRDYWGPRLRSVSRDR